MTIYPKIALITLIAIATDQISKWYVVWYLDLLTLRQMDVAPPIFNLPHGVESGHKLWAVCGRAGRGAGYPYHPSPCDLPYFTGLGAAIPRLDGGDFHWPSHRRCARQCL